MELATDVRESLGDPTRSTVADVVKAQAQIDWILWNRIATDIDREEAAIKASDVPTLVKQAEISALPGELGRQIKYSEFTVARIAAAARRLRDHTPAVWAAFRDGVVDEAKAREISSAVDQLKRPASIERLDRQVVAYAANHTTGELRRWLKHFIARVEADLFNERANDEREQRGVSITHGPNGMGALLADLPSTWLAAIDKRLTKAARAFGKDDPRTLEQRKADLVAAWLTTNENGEPAAHADIAVILYGSTLAGADQYPAASADGAWIVPTSWILELAEHGADNLFWHRMILDPVTDNVLAHEYKGRSAPDILTKALEFRDGVCQAPGCCTPAHLCDMDHRIPHEDGGPTSGWNMGPYNRRHPPPSTACRGYPHRKGFGLIDTGPTAKSPPGISRNTPLHSVGMPEPAMELQLLSYMGTHIEWAPDEAA